MEVPLNFKCPVFEGDVFGTPEGLVKIVNVTDGIATCEPVISDISGRVDIDENRNSFEVSPELFNHPGYFLLSRSIDGYNTINPN